MKVRTLLFNLCLFHKISPMWSTDNRHFKGGTGAGGQSKVATPTLSGSRRRLHRGCAGKIHSRGRVSRRGHTCHTLSCRREGREGRKEEEFVTERQHLIQHSLLMKMRINTLQKLL